MVFDRRLIKEIDYILLITVAILIVVGLIIIYSATRTNKALNNGDPFYFLKKQIQWILLGIIAFVFLINIDYRALQKFYYHIYILNILLLLAVLISGKVGGGAQRWLYFGSMGIQPSEFAKLAIVITLAQFLSDESNTIGLRKVIKAFLHIALPTVLIARQPDLGTAIVFIVIFFGMLYIAGTPKRILGGMLLIGLLASPFVYFSFLKPYQRKRLLIFLNPSADSLVSGYNIIQSKIAIGSGKVLGKGLFAGTQTQLSFLPARHTDFIFSVVGEEFGFIGSVCILFLYFILLWRALLIIASAKDDYGRLIATGVVSVFAFHIFVNIGMTLGIMPVTGLPLPFLTYGGSAMLANLIGIGLLVNVGMRRKKLVFK